MNGTSLRIPDPITFCRLDELGPEATGRFLTGDRSVIACREVEADEWRSQCGSQVILRDTESRWLGHETFGWRPTILLIGPRRYRCADGAHVWRQDTSKIVEPGAKLSRHGLRWALAGIVCQHLTVARAIEGLNVFWNRANNTELAKGRRVRIDDPKRFKGCESHWS